ncbi:glutamate transport membrane-spanning protein [Lentilactobacillus kosonis]|uniref:Glutamate transport membrane-spanning protein n=1 Tax=Lentilactobacillus kosonis TaxID=2810561 RepID=A0A401FM00_9LACO|nr:glutamate transport membrane-spanning protein [Lentilactobacillus kosonis]
MISIFQNYGGLLFQGFWQTILCSIIALFFAVIIGSGFAILEVVPNKTVHVIAKAYIELFRNIPLLVITMFFYVVIPMYIVKISGFAAGTIGLTLYSSAFIAETVRSGIQSVILAKWKGQDQMV